MKFLIAPNALKGSLTAMRAAEVISTALRSAIPQADCLLSPIADGGDGTLDCLVNGTGGRFFAKNVRGPLPDLRVDARWGAMGDEKTAVIEMAEAAGLRLLSPPRYNVMKGTTAGVGELILEAHAKGFRKIIVGLGGSATNDGGMGCCQVLGAKFFDQEGRPLEGCGENLSTIDRIVFAEKDRILRDTEMVALSDVKNLLYGTEGTSFTFAPQKGGTEEQVSLLDAGLRHYSSLIERDLHRFVSAVPGSGAAGGLGAGLIAFCGARIVSGIDFVLDSVSFDRLLRECDAVITAEGMVDGQTLLGKGIEGIARRARQMHKPLHIFAGRIRGDASHLAAELGATSLNEISPPRISIDDAMKGAAGFLSESVRRCFSRRP
ncbi:MAG TPA: glycerate kinase [Bacteroidota bacterium]|nr:glycerate kinase [Bacteroidota bacterium]